MVNGGIEEPTVSEVSSLKEEKEEIKQTMRISRRKGADKMEKRKLS